MDIRQAVMAYLYKGGTQAITLFFKHRNRPGTSGRMRWDIISPCIMTSVEFSTLATLTAFVHNRIHFVYPFSQRIFSKNLVAFML
jgi:hypothetical protein